MSGEFVNFTYSNEGATGTTVNGASIGDYSDFTQQPAPPNWPSGRLQHQNFVPAYATAVTGTSMKTVLPSLPIINLTVIDANTVSASGTAQDNPFTFGGTTYPHGLGIRSVRWQVGNTVGAAEHTFICDTIAGPHGTIPAYTTAITAFNFSFTWQTTTRLGHIPAHAGDTITFYVEDLKGNVATYQRQVPGTLATPLLFNSTANWPLTSGANGHAGRFQAGADSAYTTVSATGAQLTFALSGTTYTRADWSNWNTFIGGTESWCSIPINITLMPTVAVTTGDWWQFAEAKTSNNVGGFAEWGIYVVGSGSSHQFYFVMGRVDSTTIGGTPFAGTGHHILWQGGNADNGWHTFVVRSNYAQDNTGYLDLYYDGTKVWSMAGLPVLADTFTDLDLNSYTGGGLNPCTLVHGAPRVGTSLANVMQPGGWNVSP